MAAIVELLAPDAALVSPLSGRMVFTGMADLTALFSAVYGAVSNLRWVDVASEGHIALLRGEARIGPFHLDDAMVLELADDGRIRRIRPHFRPLLGTLAFSLVLAVRMGRHPGALLRALRGPRLLDSTTGPQR